MVGGRLWRWTSDDNDWHCRKHVVASVTYDPIPSCLLRQGAEWIDAGCLGGVAQR